MYSLLNQHDPLLSIVNAFRETHDDAPVAEGELSDAALRKEASDNWLTMAQTWIWHTVLRSTHPTDATKKVEPATPLNFLTPYVHMFVFHVHSFLLHVGSLHDFTCQNLELANNLQGKQVHRQNCRRADEEAMQVIMASLRNLLNIPAAVKDPMYKRRLFCTFCSDHQGSISMGYLRRHLRGLECPGNEAALTARLRTEIVQDSWERHFASLEKGSCPAVVVIKADAGEHFEEGQRGIRKKKRRARQSVGMDQATKKAYVTDKVHDAGIAASMGALERQQKSRLFGLAKLVPYQECRDNSVALVTKYGDLLCDAAPS
jgi:hypothetical protein